MNLEKVTYQFGNNEVFDYFILDKKENAIEQDIDKNSLAYKIGGAGKIRVSKYGEIVFNSFDLLLEKRKKGSDIFCGYSLASKDEVKRIKQ